MSIKSRKFYIISLIAIAVVAVFILIKIKRSSSDVPLQWVSPAVGTIETFVSVTGTVLPKNRLQIMPPVNGRVEKIFVQEGDKVKKGQVLALMSSTDRSALIDGAKLEGTESLNYWEKVYAPISLMTPISGEVIVRAVEPGQSVLTTTAVLVVSDRLIVKANVDETDIGRVFEGQKALISLEAHPEVEVKGTVTHIYYESVTVNNVVMYQVEIRPDKIPGLFRSGMTANINFVDKVKKDVLIIPLTALTIEGDKYFVKSLSGKGGEYLKKEIKAGLSDDDNIEVIAGLTEKDKILLYAQKMTMPQVDKSASPFFPSKFKGK